MHEGVCRNSSVEKRKLRDWQKENHFHPAEKDTFASGTREYKLILIKPRLSSTEFDTWFRTRFCLQYYFVINSWTTVGSSLTKTIIYGRKVLKI